MTYEELIIDSKVEDIYELDMKTKGLYADGVIGISKHLTNKEKACILAEELGHYHTTAGDILDQKILSNKKQERKARAWGYEKIVSISRIIEAHKAHLGSREDLLEFLDVTEEYLIEVVNYYSQKYGKYYEVGNYLICFEPLGVMKKFN